VRRNVRDSFQIGLARNPCGLNEHEVSSRLAR